jgi:hypothetical protein
LEPPGGAAPPSWPLQGAALAGREGRRMQNGSESVLPALTLALPFAFAAHGVLPVVVSCAWKLPEGYRQDPDSESQSPVPSGLSASPQLGSLRSPRFGGRILHF